MINSIDKQPKTKKNNLDFLHKICYHTYRKYEITVVNMFDKSKNLKTLLIVNIYELPNTL